jgi:phosphatidylinositol alpha-1,6-mannosyltransferase
VVSSTLLVTNDFPPKVGGIQSYLWELWQRLDPSSTAVLTARSHRDFAAFDREQLARGLRISRVRGRILFFPTPFALRRIRQACAETRPDLVLFDPVWPLGLLGPRIGVPYGVILHGAELAIPARIPLVRRGLASVLRGAAVVVSAGGYPAREAERLVGRALANVVEVPPGIDGDRFERADGPQRAATRRRLGLPEDALLVASVSRLVPRKGMDVLIEAARRLRPDHPDLVVAIAGDGRDGRRLDRLVMRTGAPVRLLGRVSEEDKSALLGVADVFVMACRNRWGGLEQEGFGIVFLEAAAAGLPQVAGESGGAAEAVLDQQTGLVVARPDDPSEVAAALGRLLSDESLRRRMGSAARDRALACFDYASLAPRLAEALAQVGG